MKIYTRRGDRGQTDLFGGARVGKADLRVSAYGDVDELNSIVGVAAAATDQNDLRERLTTIQSSLFDLGSQLATPDPEHHEKNNVPGVDASQVEKLEVEIDRLEQEVEPLKTFVLPGGNAAAAALHHARTVCRRAERSVVTLEMNESVDSAVVPYLNRLSDLLFTMARVVNARAKVPDVPWVGRER